MSYHFPILTLDQAAHEGMRLFSGQPQSVHYKLCAACIGANSIESALKKIPARSADEQIDADNCEKFLRDHMAGNIPYATDQYTDRPVREINNLFAPAL